MQWQERGMLRIGDLVDDKGTMLGLEEHKATFGIKINFIQYANLKTKVRKLDRFYNIKNSLVWYIEMTSLWTCF